jgi:hypothetical protein
MRLTLVVGAVLLACAACGPAGAGSESHGSLTPTGGGDVYKLDVTLIAPDGEHHLGTEWYVPSSGDYDATGSVVDPESRSVLAGDRFEQRTAQSGTSLVEGSRAFAQRAGWPQMFTTPGVVAYEIHSGRMKPADGLKVEASTEDGKTVLDATFTYTEDSGTAGTTFRYHVIVDGPLSMADAQKGGAFAFGDEPTSTARAGDADAPSKLRLHPYWFGPSWDGRTPRSSIEFWSADAANPADAHAPPPGGSHQITYRETSVPDDYGGLFETPIPGYPGVGDIPHGDVYVTTMRADAKPFELKGPVTSRPVTLADGTHATVLLQQYTAELFFVRTPDALIQVRLWYQNEVSDDERADVAAQLRPL